MKEQDLREAGVTLAGQVVVVTGGTGYLGSSVCKAFAEAGAEVVAVYLLDREIAWFEKTLGSVSKSATLSKADVTKAGEMDRVVKKVLARFKRIDVLVNTVGGYMAGAVAETTEDDFNRAMALNLKSTLFSCKAVLPSMRRSKRGAIVNTSSEASLVGDEESFLYSASKAGVNRLTESLARELKAANVRVNCVMPRIMDTPANREAMPKAHFSEWVKTDQVARVIRWLCSDEAARISGAAIPIYGGP
jgi:NAD(P)-dependent dehydrogenase (short-subunit alcohol dehydrogenase family)